MAAAALVFAVVAAYSNHFANPFELDDVHTIENNEAIRDIRNLGRFFVDATTFSTLPANRVYRPGTTTLNAIDTWLGGTGRPEPRVFHRSIFVSFLVLGAALYLFLLLILRESFQAPWIRWVALAGTGLFLLHTANAETVNYVIARADSFSTLMVLASFVVYIGHPGARGRFLYLIPFAIGSLVKEPALMFAPLLVVYLVLFREDVSLPELKAPSGLLACGRALRSAAPALVLSLLLFALSRAMTPASFAPGGTERWRYLLTQPFVVLHYLNNFLLPVNLAVESDWTAFSNPFDDRVFAGLGFLALLVAAAAAASRSRVGKPVAFGLLWFLIALLPTSSVFPLAEVLNDHRPFFGYVGLTLAASGLLALAIARNEARLQASAAARAAAAAVVVLLLGAHAFGVRHRNEVWQSAESLWEDAARKGPGSGRILMNYALALMARGDYPRALEYFEKARAAWPNYSYVYINLAIVKAAMGDPAAARASFEHALVLDPRNPEAYSYYAAFLRRQGSEGEAVDLANRGLALSPTHAVLRAFVSPSAIPAAGAASPTPESLLDASLASYRAGQFAESLDAALRAAELRPGWDRAWNNVCAAYNQLGRWDEAIAAGEKAVALNPASELARNNLAEARRQKGLAAAARR
jgi:tetratricopeptide (TPR) repeat protein